LDKLDAVRLELWRLRAQLLPEEELSEEEKEELERARKGNSGRLWRKS
jgi:hypothetical protein